MNKLIVITVLLLTGCAYSIKDIDVSKAELTHYSHQISKDNYKKEVYSQLYSALGFIPSKTEFFLKAERDMLNYISIINSFDNIKKSEEASALIRAKSAAKKLYELLSNIEVLNKA